MAFIPAKVRLLLYAMIPRPPSLLEIVYRANEETDVTQARRSTG